MCILWKRLELRSRYLKILTNSIETSDFADAAKHFAEFLSDFSKFKYQYIGLPEMRQLEIYEALFQAVLQLIEWSNSYLNGSMDVAAKYDAYHARASLIKPMVDSLAAKFPQCDMLVQCAESLQGMANFSDTANSLAKLRTLPFPISYRQKELPMHFSGTDGTAPSKLEKEPENFIARLLAFLDGRPWLNPQLIQSKIVYDFEITVSIPQWPSDATKLVICPSSSLSPDLYSFPPIIIARPASPQVEYRVKSNVSFLSPQSALSEPITVKLFADFYSDGAIKTECTLIGYYQLKARVSDFAANPLYAGYTSIDVRIHEIVSQIREKIGSVTQSELVSFIALLSGVVSFQAQSLHDGRYRGKANVPEKVLKDSILTFLRGLPNLGEDVIEESHTGAGEVEISYKGFIVELKVESEIKERDVLIEKYQKQPACYCAGQSKQLGILCILDLIEKENPPAIAANNILAIEPELHGFEGHASPTYPTIIIAVIIDGNLRNPSSYSRGT
jgi:hypothetical protein